MSELIVQVNANPTEDNVKRLLESSKCASEEVQRNALKAITETYTVNQVKTTQEK